MNKINLYYKWEFRSPLNSPRGGAIVFYLVFKASPTGGGLVGAKFPFYHSN